MTLEREELRVGWTAALAQDAPPSGAPERIAGAVFPATVPGQIHIDLEREGFLPDQEAGATTDVSAWVGRSDWSYRTTVDIDPHGFERVDLVADGLDTVASLTLDGVQIGVTRNMHRRYRFDLRDATDGSNTRSQRELEIVFESPYREAAKVAARFGTMPGPYDQPFAYVRKMALNFGWDWAPPRVTSGPWRPVAIERWSTARLRDVRPLVDVDAGEGVLDAHVAFERSGMNDLDHDGEDDDLVVVVTVSGHGERQRSRVHVTPAEDSAVVTVRIPEAELWWPRGYGAQPLYDVDVELQTVDGDVLDRRAFRTGFRSVGIDTELDDGGRPFLIRVNGVDIDVRGVNWVPDDIIVSRVDRARYAARLGTAASLNVNLVRVWGGGVYESSDFYETCDALGVLVWQDFAFACSSYPEGEPFRTEVIAEARDNVARLARHPSLVVWNGSNENIWLHDANRWSDELGDREWGLGYYLDLLPTIVDAVDPSRFYTADSPWSGDERLDPNDIGFETHHSWDVWNRLSDDHYRDSVPRFVTEFGWQAPPAWRTMRDAVPDTQLTPMGPGVRRLQRAVGGNDLLAHGLQQRFGDAPDDFDRWHYLTQLQQVRAVATGVEHWRTHWPTNTGVVLWQLNDASPAISWSAIDHAGRAKPLAHELRRLYDDVLLAIRPLPGAVESHQARIEIAVRSDVRQLDDVVRIRRVDVHGAVMAEASVAVTLDQPGVAVIAVPDTVAVLGDPHRELLVADLGERRAVWTGAPDKEMAWSPAEFRVELTERDDGVDMVVTASSLVRDLLVQPDRVRSSGTVDHGFVTLLPGERAELRCRGIGAADAEQLVAEPALWTLDRVLRT